MLKSINNLIFGPSPEESVKSWQNNIRKQGRLLDREIKQVELYTYIHIYIYIFIINTFLQLDVSINKAKANLKSLVKVNDKKSLRILTKEIIKTDKQKIRLINSKSQLNSINMQLSHQLLTLKFTGSLKKSNEIMKLSSSLINLPQLSSTMSQMSQEMMKVSLFYLFYFLYVDRFILRPV